MLGNIFKKNGKKTNEPEDDEKIREIRNEYIKAYNELAKAYKELNETNRELVEKTAELQEAKRELDKFYRLTIGRELRMKELKEEIKKKGEEINKFKKS